MRIERADHAGACYGVCRALGAVYAALDDYEEVCTLGPLIHNPLVVDDLERRGAHVADTVDDVMCQAVVIRSHGAAPGVRDELEMLGSEVIDATCPHVARAQSAAAELAAHGAHVLVVGEEGHPEVEALVAYARAAAPDGSQASDGSHTPIRVDVVGAPDDIPDDLASPVGVVVQTTQTRENLDAVVDALMAREIAPVVRNTICAATTQRQAAAAELAERVDAMVVIGGRNSSNTTRLAEICAAHCPQVLHVESPQEVEEHIPRLLACETVGVTAGASTPEDQIRAVVERLEAAARDDAAS